MPDPADIIGVVMVGFNHSIGGRAPALNIVSIGDQLFERVASHAAARVWDLVKTVKLLGEWSGHNNFPTGSTPALSSQSAFYHAF